MRDMIETFQWAWKYDRKEFVSSFVFAICWLVMVWLVFWFFIPVFAYDM